MCTDGKPRMSSTDVLCVLVDTHERPADTYGRLVCTEQTAHVGQNHPNSPREGPACGVQEPTPHGLKSPEQSMKRVSVLSPTTNVLICVLIDSHGRPVFADRHTHTHTDSPGCPVCADGHTWTHTESPGCPQPGTPDVIQTNPNKHVGVAAIEINPYLSCQPKGQASIDGTTQTSIDRITPTSTDKDDQTTIDRRYEFGYRAFDMYGARKFTWERRDEYGVYRDECGHARGVAGEMIPELKSLVEDTHQPLDRGDNELFRSMVEMRTEIESLRQQLEKEARTSASIDAPHHRSTSNRWTRQPRRMATERSQSHSEATRSSTPDISIDRQKASEIGR
ncbi:unnamed protein product [Brassica rapa]|uniref:Uncharacterized protein n=1 Tax=Brassica campestris TaxID=3711 RepID=A0A8D9G0X7_BRACM|nr:unnamed protein product [Brassica rapa]